MGWEGYLTLDGVEIINAARTEAYAATAGAPWFKPVYNNDALRVLLGQSPYSTPGIDLAPWYDEDTVDSYNFWGFYPLSVDGLDDSSRTGNPVEFTTDGGSPGRVRSTMKSVVYSGLLVGETETAVEYGMRWLRRALLGAKCATVRADTTTLGSTVGFLSAAPVFPLYLPGSSPVDGDTVFLSGGDATGIPAPYAATPEYALRQLQRFYRNSKVVDGPTVARQYTMRTGCGGYAWQVQFTVQVGDPHPYGAEQSILQGYLDPSVSNPWSPSVLNPGTASTSPVPFIEPLCGEDIWQPIYDPTCLAMIAPPAPPSVPFGCYDPDLGWTRYIVSLPDDLIPAWDSVVPVMTIYNASVMRSMRVRWYENPDGDFDPNDNPCDFVGDWLISYLPAGASMVIDGVAQQVRVTTPLGHVRRADSLVFQYNSTPIMWPTLSCGWGYIMTIDIPGTEPVPVVDLSFVPKAAA